MSYDPSKTIDHAGTDPDKGLKTRPYLKAVLVAIMVLLAAAFFLARSGSRSAPPIKPATTSSGDNKPATSPQ